MDADEKGVSGAVTRNVTVRTTRTLISEAALVAAYVLLGWQVGWWITALGLFIVWFPSWLGAALGAFLRHRKRAAQAEGGPRG